MFYIFFLTHILYYLGLMVYHSRQGCQLVSTCALHAQDRVNSGHLSCTACPHGLGLPPNLMSVYPYFAKSSSYLALLFLFFLRHQRQRRIRKMRKIRVPRSPQKIALGFRRSIFSVGLILSLSFVRFCDQVKLCKRNPCKFYLLWLTSVLAELHQTVPSGNTELGFRENLADNWG